MLKIYSSLSQQKEEFKPIQAGKVGIYVCGMTVYDYCHLGHARVLVCFDIITRYLRAKGYDVNYVRNITDVDDKILNRARDNGESVDALTARFIDAMHEDERALGVLSPTSEPRATGHIDEIIAMIQRLMDKGYAYHASNGDVYYAVEQFADYGKLSKQKLDEIRAGARIEVDAEKRSPADFVLWKAAKPGELSWNSPWGEGRPGWHIECSAMSTQCLGDTFDIHGGGPDLKFPHHENEIAQSEAATGCKYVNYWMHAGAVRVNKEKMSKSLGNFFTIREILDKYPAEVVRYFLASSHYRSAIDYSDLALEEARSGLERLYNSIRELYGELSAVSVDESLIGGYRERFHQAMDDDFNTSSAVAVLFDMAKAVNVSKKEDRATALSLAKGMIDLAEVLGLLQANPESLMQGEGEEVGGLSVDEIEGYIARRNAARANKDFAESDRIRDLLKDKGVLLNDSREGTTWQRA
ncbi:cysteine--tRNA ligase [Hahella sp. KA22]|uniref:cysteine--tRNA ligase n=1 Tax=Hahella sp. KA22 TaxID=1628392 RepID=UPI000FDEA455|nr:cysteine--tRNA ligase [Hahella sp. KA22]AZZ91551.1 cysteine--tRNA ligase [Hahella sp. KA22]QAY54921.1 cysteine--tRNA ligase [Hahella sp. KA22]